MSAKSVYKQLCQQFGKRKIDYAMKQARHPTNPFRKHKAFCEFDKDHLGACGRRKGGKQ